MWFSRGRILVLMGWVLLGWFGDSAGQTSGGATVTGISRSFNPAISANGLFLGGLGSEEEDLAAGDSGKGGHGEELTNGIALQELEIQLSAFVDPFVKADLILALPGGEGMEVEEGFITTLGLPGQLTLKAGKFFAALGKHNLLHTHQFPFIDNTLVNERLFGEEGLNEPGVELSRLVPLPWYTEIQVDLLNGDNELLFASPNSRHLAYLIHLKNFWDLSESTTLELGGTYLAGRNVLEEWTQGGGFDLTVKWKPLRRAVYRSFIWQTEYLVTRQDFGGMGRETAGGLYSLIQYQCTRRWWIQGRYDGFGWPQFAGQPRAHQGTLLLAFVPSEFSALRLQYGVLREGDQTSHQALLQFNFTIGSHPAHKY